MESQFLRNIPFQNFQFPAQALDREFRIFKYYDTSKDKIYPHAHDFYELYILISGRIKYHTADHFFYLAPDDFLFLNKNQLHFPEVIDSTIPYERIALHVSPDLLMKLSDTEIDLTKIFTQSEFKVYHYPPYLLDQIRIHLNQLAELYYHPETYGARLLARAKIAELFVLFSRYIDSPSIYSFDKTNKNVQLISISKQYIGEHLEQRITIDDIAKYFLMNKFYFMHQFKEVAGISFQQFLTHVRLEHVKTKVENGIPLHVASSECGFQDYSSFYRHFMNEFGTNPREYFKKSET